MVAGLAVAPLTSADQTQTQTVACCGKPPGQT
ncbi:hypothetical protein QFZ24_000081 [Streptomyces phaeochromogenes]|nr:hypothetical protein [Streptomyces phaeochromogenes]